jgi:hypothetical protein
MKASCLALFVITLFTGCQTRLSHDEKLVAWNGVIRQGSMVSVTHVNPGVYPSETLAYANADLGRKIRDITGDFYADCLLVPQIHGYDIVILSKRYLTEAQKEEIYSYIEKAVDKAWTETEIYRKKSE